MKLLIILITTLTFTSLAIPATEEISQDCINKNVPDSERAFSNTFSGTFNGKRLEYRASLKEKLLYEKDNPSAPMASFFYTEYIVKSDKNRPVIFSFNGGPGSASLWLHMGVLGPKVIKVPSDASDDGSAPYKIVDNKLSPLSDADLVFIDPIGTGYSRAVGCHEPEEFWGVSEDPKIIA